MNRLQTKKLQKEIDQKADELITKMNSKGMLHEIQKEHCIKGLRTAITVVHGFQTQELYPEGGIPTNADMLYARRVKIYLLDELISELRKEILKVENS